MAPPQIIITPPTKNTTNKRKEKLQRQPRGSRQKTRETSRPGTYTTTGESAKKNSQKITERSRTPDETENNATQTRQGRTDDRNYVTAQTTEGSYESRLRIENPNNCPIQKKLNLARYSIPEPPIMMRKVPQYYTSEGLRRRKALKFDMRNP